MLGIILCGGQSSRMGSDKGLVTLNEKTWTQRALEKLSVLGIPVKISINYNQYLVYKSEFSSVELIVDNPSLTVKGPLLGVLSSHLKYPSEDLFILACDMPLMESDLLNELYSQYQDQTTAGAIVFTNNGEWEPLCGIYFATGLTYILSLLQSGQIIKHSMKNMLDHLQVKSIPLSSEQKKAVRNFNSHSELNGL
jgi:molybdopterin-guanine dinucleotide biosynthesis protein A